MMSLALLLILSGNVVASEPTEAHGLKFYVTCHERLEAKLTSENAQTPDCGSAIPLPDISQLTQISSDLGMEKFLRYYQREQMGEEYTDFLTECSQEEARFHADIARLTRESYDISFLDRANPNLENDRGGAPPEGYTVGKFYGSNPEACYQSGFKAALFLPNEGDHVVFAITGTEGSETYRSGKKRESYLSSKESVVGGIFGTSTPIGTTISAKDKDKEDWTPVVGRRQFSTSCAQELMQDALRFAREQNKRIVFTGHSLGGAIAQGMGYRVQEQLLRTNPDARAVDVVSFMSAGGRGIVGKSKVAVEERLNSVMYASLGDIVSNLGNHVGEIREMVRTDEYEQRFRNLELGILDTHTMDLRGFKPLSESVHVTGQELGKRFMNYTRSFSEPQEKGPPKRAPSATAE